MRTIADLPIELQKYVRGESAFPSTEFIAEDKRFAKELRKMYLRGLQSELPGEQWREIGYADLMRGEIQWHAKHVLLPKVLSDWEESLSKCPRLASIYKVTPMPRSNEKHSAGKIARLTMERQRRAFASAIQDPRTLGEIEMHCTARVFYGMPHGQNFDPRYD